MTLFAAESISPKVRVRSPSMTAVLWGVRRAVSASMVARLSMILLSDDDCVTVVGENYPIQDQSQSYTAPTRFASGLNMPSS